MQSGIEQRTVARIRIARPSDASAIATLYDDAYRPAGGGAAKDHYPFPQFLDPPWLAGALSEEKFRWIVADLNNEIIGSAGAVRNIGERDDKVSEVFGIVVAEKHRGQGIASRLLATLKDSLAEDAMMILCESRTALSAGWKVPRNNGFKPLGIEPFAHYTPAGPEPMLMTAYLNNDALEKRDPTQACYDPVRALAHLVLRPFGMHSAKSDAARRISNEERPVDLEAVRDDSGGKAFLAQERIRGRHGSGVVGFDRLEGHDPLGIRYDTRYLVVRKNSVCMGAVKIVIDWGDRRARILHLEAGHTAVQQLLIKTAFQQLESIGQELVAIVIDVIAGATKIQATLERLGFRATVYYPALVESAGTRLDAVQYTCILRKEIEETLSCMAPLEWSAASQILRYLWPSFHMTKPLLHQI